MSLVTVSKVGEVLLIGDVGLRDNHGIRFYVLDQGPEKAHQLVGLSKIDAGRSDLFPNESHGIEAEQRYSLIQMLADDFH